jgi:hypothetical protein
MPRPGPDPLRLPVVTVTVRSTAGSAASRLRNPPVAERLEPSYGRKYGGFHRPPCQNSSPVPLNIINSSLTPSTRKASTVSFFFPSVVSGAQTPRARPRPSRVKRHRCKRVLSCWRSGASSDAGRIAPQRRYRRADGRGYARKADCPTLAGEPGTLRAVAARMVLEGIRHALLGV